MTSSNSTRELPTRSAPATSSRIGGTSVGSTATPILPSRRLGRHDDDARVFRQFHGGIEGTDEAILHDAGHGQGSTAAGKVGLDGQGGRVGRHVEGREVWFRGELFVKRAASGAAVINAGN